MVEFNESGVLPVGVHDCDDGEFRRLLVDGFPESTSRAIIAAGFTNLRSDACACKLAGVQWVDGSYVTDRADPDDVDVVTFVDLGLLESLEGTPAEEFIMGVLVRGPETPARYRSDSYLVAVAPESHPYRDEFLAACDYWRNWFGQMRTLLGPDGAPLPARSKGILQMELGDPLKRPQVTAWGGGSNG